MRIATPTLRPVDRKELISLLRLLSKLREELNALGVAETAAVRVLAFLLDGDAKSMYDSVTMTGRAHEIRTEHIRGRTL